MPAGCLLGWNMKLLALAVIVTALAVCCAVIPVHGQQTGDSANHQQQKSPSQTSSGVVVNEETSGRQSDKNDDHSQNYFYRLIAAETLPNTILCLVGIVGIVAAIRTLGLMQHQVDVMRQQADIQAAGMQQWVDVEEREVNAHEMKDQSLKLELTFEAVNNTNYPLTIEQVVTSFELLTRAPIKFTIRDIKMLAPSAKSGMNLYPFFVSARLEGNDVDRVMKGTVVGIFGQITFKDCLQQTRVQDFGGMYLCSMKGFKYMKPMGMVPDQETDKDDGQPKS